MLLVPGANVIPLAPSYGEIYADNVSVALACTLQNTYYKCIAFASAGLASADVTVDTANKRLQVTRAGDYFVSFTHDHVGSVNDNYETTLFAGPAGSTVVKIAVHGHQRNSSATAVSSVSGSGFVTLAANDTLELWVACTTSAGTNITTESVFLSLYRVK